MNTRTTFPGNMVVSKSGHQVHISAPFACTNKWSSHTSMRTYTGGHPWDNNWQIMASLKHPAIPSCLTINRWFTLRYRGGSLSSWTTDITSMLRFSWSKNRTFGTSPCCWHRGSADLGGCTGIRWNTYQFQTFYLGVLVECLNQLLCFALCSCLAVVDYHGLLPGVAACRW